MSSLRRSAGRRSIDRRPVALLVTHSGDFFTIDRVQRAVQRLGWDAVRFDSDTFPLQTGLAVEVADAGVEAVLELPERHVRLSSMKAVWLRRLWPPVVADGLSAADAEACAAASSIALHDALAHLTSCRWVNPLEASTRAESKVLQLVHAKRLGFDVPPTVITNEPAWVERLQRTSGTLVTKLLTPLSYAMQSERFMYTSVVDDDARAQLGSLRHAPQMFQPLLEKARELRVVVVGREVFAASIDASRTKEGRVDWRRLRAGSRVPWKKTSLRPALERKLHRLLRALGLVSGALDFIETHDGRLHFLEVNPAGEWGWLERDLGYDISGAFARALTRGTR